MNNDYLRNLSSESHAYADSLQRYETQLPLLFSYPVVSGSRNPDDLYRDDSSYLAYPSGVHKTVVVASTRDRYGSLTITSSGQLSFYIQVAEFAADSDQAFIGTPVVVSGEGGATDLFFATYYENTPQDPWQYAMTIPQTGTYSVVFPNPVSSRAFTVTHSGSAPYSITQLLPRKLVQRYDIEVNSIKAYHVSSTLIDTIALQVSDSIVVGSGLIGEKSIDGAKIVDGTISGVLITNGTVTGNKVQAGTISGVLITAGTITGDKIQAATISGALITAGTITFDKVASNTLTAAQIADSAITGQKIANGTISGVLIADNTVSASKIQANTITANQIAAGTITGDRIAASTISGALITAGTLTGDKIAAATISGDRIAAGTITADNITTRTITADKIVLSGITADLLGPEAVTAAALASGAVISGKLAANSVLANNVTAGVIQGYHVAASTITGANIAAATISGSLITAGTITADRIASSSLTATQIADGAITGQKILAGTISGVLITDGTVSASKIQANTITASQIAAGTITGDRIAAATISGVLLTASGITGDKIAAKTITVDNLSVSQLDAVASNMGSLVVNSGISVATNGSITAGNTRINNQGISIGSLTTTSLGATDAIQIVGSGGSGDLIGLAMYNASFSAVNPLATIRTNSTNALKIENYQTGSTFTDLNFPTTASTTPTAATRIFNANLDIRRTPVVGSGSADANKDPGAIRGYDSDETLVYELSSDRIVLRDELGNQLFLVDAVSAPLGSVTITGNTDLRGDVTVSGSISHRDAGILLRTANQTVNAGTSARVQLNVAGTGNIIGNTTSGEMTVAKSGLYLVHASVSSATTNLTWNVRANATSFTTGTLVLAGLTFNDGRALNTNVFYLTNDGVNPADKVGLFVNNTGGSAATVTGSLRIVRLT